MCNRIRELLSTMNSAEFDEIKPDRAMFILLHSLSLGIR